MTSDKGVAFYTWHVTCTQSPHQYFNSLAREILEVVSGAKYLGIEIDNKLDLSKHILIITGRCHSNLAYLHRNLPQKLRHCLCTLLVRPNIAVQVAQFGTRTKS